MRRWAPILSLLLVAIALELLVLPIWFARPDWLDGTSLFRRSQPAPLSQEPTFQDALVRALAAQDRHQEDLLGIPGVAGVATGIGPLGLPVVKVLLERDLALGLPAQLDGAPVYSEVSGRFMAIPGERMEEAEASNPRRFHSRPVPIGISSGQVDVTAGTIGARVRSGDEVFALSNNHVFANRNNANLGDDILQPGRVDGGTPDDAIGTLHDFEPIRFCSPFPVCPSNRIDAAIAATSENQLGIATPEDGYGAPLAQPIAARLGMEVQKYGRTTGLTRGRVTGINATINVGFGNATARFTGQIVIEQPGFSNPGDSGSLIVSANASSERRPVALLFAGSANSTIANPIQLVLDRFGVGIDGERGR